MPFGMVEATETYILNNTRRTLIIDGSSLHREERPEIPPPARYASPPLQRVLPSPLRDPAAIQTDIFWDAVDIYNPGSFLSGLSPDDYMSGAETVSKPRNQLIASTLYRLGDIETHGAGLRRAGRARQNLPAGRQGNIGYRR